MRRGTDLKKVEVRLVVSGATWKRRIGHANRWTAKLESDFQDYVAEAKASPAHTHTFVEVVVCGEHNYAPDTRPGIGDPL